MAWNARRWDCFDTEMAQVIISLWHLEHYLGGTTRGTMSAAGISFNKVVVIWRMALTR